jgi:hypothetical protein
MTAARHDQRVVVTALVLSLVAIVVMAGDKLTNPDIVNRQTFDLLQLVFAVIALAAGVAVLVRSRRSRSDDEPVIDLRERLADHVDIDDVATDHAMRTNR